MIERHFAWFDRAGGHWLGEWKGLVPAPDVPTDVSDDERQRLLNAWAHEVQAGITPEASAWPTLAQEWDRDAWDACPAGGAVCLDVGRFQWPVGDHVWHRWSEVDRLLDWGETHLFLELDLATRSIVANTASHRPVRPRAGRVILDVTHTALAAVHGDLFGTLVRRAGGWALDPVRDTDVVPAPVQRALESARVDLDLFNPDLIAQPVAAEVCL